MQSILNFLTDLKANNNREWFADNKTRYTDAVEKFEYLVNVLILKIKHFDNSIDVNSAKDCMFRIYKDTRFSNNKEPYKTNMGAYIAKGGKKSFNAGYYIHIEPNASFAGGGVYCPPAPVLKNLRDDLAHDAEEFRAILAEPNFVKEFKALEGDQVKTAPRGYDKNHPNIDLLRFTSYVVLHNFSDSELISPDYPEKLVSIFQLQKPFNQYLNAIIANSEN